MKTVLKWLGRGILALLVLLVAAAVLVYVLSERKLNVAWDVPVEAITIPTDSAALDEGERLARIYGCYNGCHGEAAGGQLFFEEPILATVTSPDLTRAVHSLSDAELVRVIRHGIGPDGRGVVVMPSPDFYHLTDEDLGSIIGFVRSLPRSDGPEASVRLGPMGRALFALGEFRTAAEDIDHEAPRLDPGDGSDPLASGEYLARTACAECHGENLEGSEGAPEPTPNLRITSAYSPAEFRTLMRTGVPRDGRQLRLMDQMSIKRFSYFTAQEVDALYAFLSGLPAN